VGKAPRDSRDRDLKAFLPGTLPSPRLPQVDEPETEPELEEPAAGTVPRWTGRCPRTSPAPEELELKLKPRLPRTSPEQKLDELEAVELTEDAQNVTGRDPSLHARHRSSTCRHKDLKSAWG
jgi:hypothetical protein